MHKAARKIVEGEEKVDIKKKSLKELLGPAPFEDEDENLKPQIGVVRGLAWTSVGGDTLSIEVNVMPGKGKDGAYRMYGRCHERVCTDWS